MRLFVLSLAVMLITGAPGTAGSQPADLPVHLTVGDARLQLRGNAKRSVLFIDIYRCAIYLPSAEAPYDSVAAGTAAAVIVDVLAGGGAEEIPDDWRRTLRDELETKAFRKVRNTYRTLEAGDRVSITYAPGGPTQVKVNGTHIASDPGNGLIRGLLDQWTGENPVSVSLKNALLDRTKMQH